MSKLATIEDIKIPYPSEGMIRTAQIDDTLSPENSAQLAVNMNFDRVGALQTRLGLEEYATSLGEEILNYGTLRNSVIPDGYTTLSTLGESSLFTGAIMMYPTSAKIDDEHVIIFWSGTDSDGFVQVMETSLQTGGLVPLGTPLEFDIANGTYNKCIRIDSTHFLNIWRGTSTDAFAQVFSVNSTTYAVTAVGTALEFDITNGAEFSVAQVDASHFIVFYVNQDTADGIATILAVDVVFTVTEPGVSLTFSTNDVFSNSCVPIGNGTHFINFWSDPTSLDGFAQVFSVNLSTWAITAIGTPFSFEANAVGTNAASSLGDGQHFVNFWLSFTSSNGVARVFNVNPSTYAITAAGAQFTFQTGLATEITSVSFGDGQHVFTSWVNSSQMYAQIFEINLSTFTITSIESPINFGAESSSAHSDSLLMSPYRVISLWRSESTFGQGLMFRARGDIIYGQYLYAGHGDEVSNWDGTSWTVRRSGLAQVSKPRFSQYLGYLWMVNGNSSLGGDPVATSNGGAFGTDMVPEDFPAGDFIHAGFEGRVWVVDKRLGIIYYTDIVQFVPPDVYSLSYNSQVNFITTISPQTGESITALKRVPRALLVFTENTITRIYGATSIDAYPAYNVGTYSQESIIETKTGIFFHHSSGFYQFDYGSQPVEISRRIIDFVKAIPRSSYEDITGVYDGFDAVKWSIGTVVVEGVTFSNCVLRYTISTQVWTVYDYTNNVITAMISYDDGTALNHLVGTSVGITAAMDVGYTDLGQPFYYDYIDRWRSYTDMYCVSKALGGLSVYSENAAGANLSYQTQKSGVNVWHNILTIDERNNSFQENSGTEDFDVCRLRISGNTSGTPVVIHGIEITQLTIKGFV